MIAVLPIGVFTSIVTNKCAALETTVMLRAPDPSFTYKTATNSNKLHKQKLNGRPYFVFIYSRVVILPSLLESLTIYIPYHLVF